jgi:hypothetical protein
MVKVDFDISKPDIEFTKEERKIIGWMSTPKLRPTGPRYVEVYEVEDMGYGTKRFRFVNVKTGEVIADDIYGKDVDDLEDAAQLMNCEIVW